MTLLIFAAVAALIFGIGDAIMLPRVMQPMFKRALGHQMLEQYRIAPAVGFYLIHVAGLVWFAGRPLMDGGTVTGAALNGAILGLVCFACYEMTSYAIMRDWKPTMVVVDIAWGTVLSGLAAFGGALAASWFMGR